MLAGLTAGLEVVVARGRTGTEIEIGLGVDKRTPGTSHHVEVRVAVGRYTGKQEKRLKQTRYNLSGKNKKSA